MHDAYDDDDNDGGAEYDDDNDDGMAPESNWFWPKWKQQAMLPICSTIVEKNSDTTQSTIVKYHITTKEIVVVKNFNHRCCAIADLYCE